MIDEKLLEALNNKMITEDVPIYQRPMAVAVEISKAEKSKHFYSGQLMSEITDFYKRKYSPKDLFMPSIQIGGVGLRDKFYKVKVSLVLGSCPVNMIECIDISQKELESIHGQYPDAIPNAAYTVADLWDFAYGVNDLKGKVPQADLLWGKACSSIEETARLLSDGQRIDGAVQPICLSAELGLKAVLTFLGADEAALKKLGHNITKLVNELSTKKPAASDATLQEAAGKFPNYVETRYSPHGLNRVDLHKLAMLSEYISADAVRRICSRNMIDQVLKGHKRQIP